MEFALTGPHQGKTMKLAGFSFKDGVTEVPDEARDAHNLLTLHYACFPSHTLMKDEKGKLVKKPTDGSASISMAGPPVSGKSEPHSAKDPEEKLSDLSKAELKVKASEMGLDPNGTKEDLMVRIQEVLDKAQS